ncbi:MAG TPA: thymidine phosphorylase [Candidatus Merdousia gallistercoris]|nr:thymidine phosphorylase [Candidatus Merdousia gallistercoris]
MAIRKIIGKPSTKASYAYLIEKKRDGHEFTEEEVRNIVDSILDDEMPDSQMAALIMAIYFKDMAAQETAVFADEMILTGETLDLSHITRPKVAKYSTGGVGDKTSLILAAVGAACGVVVPGMTSPDEDFVLTVEDKMASIPGFKTKLSLDEFQKQLSTIGCAICEHDNSISPVDEKIYNMRHMTATIPSLPLITASVLSKKFAIGADGLVVDVKWGNGSYLRDIEQARQLARTITRVARVMKHRCVALITDMNQPLGDSVGMGLEVLEALDFLRGGGSDDIKELVLKLGMEILRLAGVAGSTLSAKQSVERVIEDGSALKKFMEMIKAQGGSAPWLEDPSKYPMPKHVRKLPAPKRGYVHNINSGMIARAVQILAKTKTGKIDPYVGVTEIKKIGTQVKQGEPLLMIHYNDETNLDSAIDYLRNAYRLAPRRPNPSPVVVERVA